MHIFTFYCRAKTWARSRDKVFHVLRELVLGIQIFRFAQKDAEQNGEAHHYLIFVSKKILNVSASRMGKSAASANVENIEVLSYQRKRIGPERECIVESEV